MFRMQFSTMTNQNLKRQQTEVVTISIMVNNDDNDNHLNDNKLFVLLFVAVLIDDDCSTKYLIMFICIFRYVCLYIYLKVHMYVNANVFETIFYLEFYLQK